MLWMFHIARVDLIYVVIELLVTTTHTWVSFENLDVVWFFHILPRSLLSRGTTPNCQVLIFFRDLKEHLNWLSDPRTFVMGWEHLNPKHMWVCLKIVYPYTQWLMIIIPTKMAIIGGIPHFQTYPCQNQTNCPQMRIFSHEFWMAKVLNTLNQLYGVFLRLCPESAIWVHQPKRPKVLALLHTCLATWSETSLSVTWWKAKLYPKNCVRSFQ